MLRQPVHLVLLSICLLATPIGSIAGQAQSPASLFRGEYFVTENKDSICVPYTRNLNQFRRLDFDACDPRLSTKYPQLTRPEWEEIPLDLALAEQIVRNGSLAARDADGWWQAWLTASESARAEEKLRLWRLRIDVDNDGTPDTILRLDNPFTAKGGSGGKKSWTSTRDRCTYRNGRLYMLDSGNASMRQGFNQVAYTLTDVLHFAGGQTSPGTHNGYYGVDWRLGLPSPLTGRRIGATRGLTVYTLFNMGAGESCRIDWVPTHNRGRCIL